MEDKEPIISPSRCPVCSSYYDLPKDKQIQAALILEKLNKSTVTSVSDGLWKIDPNRKGGIVEYVSAKTLIDRARERQLEYETPKRRGRRKVREEVSEDATSVQVDQGRSDESVGEGILDSSSNKRRRKSSGIRGNGKRSSGTSSTDKRTGATRTRKTVKPVRKPRSSNAGIQTSDTASEAPLERKSRLKSDRSESSGVGQRNGIQPKTRRRLSGSSLPAKTRRGKRKA